MRALVISTFVLLGGVAVACSSSDRPAAATTSSSSSSSSSAGGEVTDAGEDVDAEAGLPTENDDVCKNLEAPAAPLMEISEPFAAPSPSGGTIMPGTYELDALYTYGTGVTMDGGEGTGGNEGLSGNSGVGTLVITTNTMAFNEAYGPNDSLPAVAARGYAYYGNGATLYAAQVCPTVTATAPLPYSAVGATISFFPTANRRVVYKLK